MNSQLGSQRGFTLIEILVVVFIIGLTAGMISLSVGDRKSETGPRKEAQTFLQAMDFVSEFAQLNGEVIGMFVEQRDVEGDTLAKQWCYQWKRLRDGNWGPLPEDSLDPHCMEENMQWDLIVEGHAYTYDPNLEKQPPILVFSPSGEATPIEMAIFEQGASGDAQHIEIDMMGNSHWRNQEEAEKRDAR